ncbi:MAG: substrate-binding domain-containing protein, partial [Alistipes sp.]|nr:substrate-binding domain-containing protein [Alistipes sp.]
YLDVLKESGLADRAMVRGARFSVDNGYLETKLALNSGAQPTAIFAMSNTILLGAIKAVRESGLRVPDDISLVSFDNSSYLDLLDPAITHVSQPINNMGTLAIKILMEKIDGQSDANASIELPAQLVISASVKRM